MPSQLLGAGVGSRTTHMVPTHPCGSCTARVSPCAACRDLRECLRGVRVCHGTATHLQNINITRVQAHRPGPFSNRIGYSSHVKISNNVQGRNLSTQPFTPDGHPMRFEQRRPDRACRDVMLVRLEQNCTIFRTNR